MTNETRLKNISVPEGMVDVVLDTDAYNEIDDQFAIAYLLRCKEKLNTKAIYAAPFFNGNSTGPADGMEKSYDEILKLLSLLNEDMEVFKGAPAFLENENTPIVSPASLDLVERAKQYTPERPLYVVAIGAITNIASAILTEPAIVENIVVVWLGGNATHYHNTKEFNMMGDIAAARVVMGSDVPCVQLPCKGVVSSFCISKPELEFGFKGKNSISDYLAANTIKAAESYAANTAWTRCIWDVTAVAWLMNDKNRFMESRTVPAHKPTYDHFYEPAESGNEIRYVYNIRRDALMNDLIKRLIEDK